MAGAVLHHGEFFGVRDAARETRGYSLSIKTAHEAISVERHTHEDAHFVLLLDGHYLSSARGAGHIYAEPALIYNPAGTTHRDTFPERSGRFLGISLAGERLAEIAAVGPTVEEPERIWDPAALALANRIARGILDEPSDFALECQCLQLVSILVLSLRDERRPPRWLRAAREQLHDRANEELTVGEIAGVTGVHPVYLARAFRRFYGCSPGDYVRRIRIERAAHLIRSTSMPLAQVALVAGFVDQSHMTRVFARGLRITPAAYRRRHA
jgi:AraC family transcriptional regulator